MTTVLEARLKVVEMRLVVAAEVSGLGPEVVVFELRGVGL